MQFPLPNALEAAISVVKTEDGKSFTKSKSIGNQKSGYRNAERNRNDYSIQPRKAKSPKKNPQNKKGNHATYQWKKLYNSVIEIFS